jgi:site-specific DNA recombinase
VRYRYYVSRDAHQGNDKASALRIPAREIEALVIEQVAGLFDDPMGLIAKTDLVPTPALMASMDVRCRDIAAAIRSSSRTHLAELVAQVQIGKGGVDIDASRFVIAKLLDAEIEGDTDVVTVTTEARLARTGRVVRLVHQDGQAATASPPDRSLIRQFVQARHWWAVLREGEINITALAAREGVTASWMTRVLRLAFLSPHFVDAILRGALPPRIDGLAMIKPGAVSVSWTQQRMSYFSATCAGAELEKNTRLNRTSRL